MNRILNEYPSVILKADNLENEVDFADIFGRQRPVHIEIGSGRGTFLLNQAKLQPEVNFLGIEWASKYYRYSVDRIGRWGLANVRILRTEAADFLTRCIPDNSVDCFHIYFPDPWPKKKHHKRRFFSPSNLIHLLRCLKDGGIIRFVTDHEDYFQHAARVWAEHKDRLCEIEFTPAAGTRDGELVGTNFERKYLPENRAIYALALKKKPCQAETPLRTA